MGIPAKVFDLMQGEARSFDLTAVPAPVRAYMEAAHQRTQRRIYYGGRARFSWHCRTRRHIVRYVSEEYGTTGFREVIAKICPRCGHSKEKSRTDFSGVPI